MISGKAHAGWIEILASNAGKAVEDLTNNADPVNKFVNVPFMF